MIVILSKKEMRFISTDKATLTLSNQDTIFVILISGLIYYLLFLAIDVSLLVNN